jgi:hypothetical protein
VSLIQRAVFLFGGGGGVNTTIDSHFGKSKILLPNLGDTTDKAAAAAALRSGFAFLLRHSRPSTDKNKKKKFLFFLVFRKFFYKKCRDFNF